MRTYLDGQAGFPPRGKRRRRDISAHVLAGKAVPGILPDFIRQKLQPENAFCGVIRRVLPPALDGQGNFYQKLP